MLFSVCRGRVAHIHSYLPDDLGSRPRWRGASAIDCFRGWRSFGTADETDALDAGLELGVVEGVFHGREGGKARGAYEYKDQADQAPRVK